eukprot:gnl/MRDRNA2_/MRDRNA2_86513_c0_seq3.p1 gnl/MRDRNA2_/MRDRNA2_86513_c0~~gnl/MRDRNA2_/MRDRNA2_86513_c0_seq3.p1  ORF type:complete len:332 (+),score=-5.90 gnl/MRDRNA2_/MRDRNA2_86513_c0_seq3:368-1363(+)
MLLTSSWDHTIRLWSLLGTRYTNTILVEEYDVMTFALRPDGRQLALSISDGTLRLQDSENFRGEISEIEKRRDNILLTSAKKPLCQSMKHLEVKYTSVSYSADSAYLLAGASDGHISIYEAKRGLLLQKFSFPKRISKNPPLKLRQYMTTCIAVCPSGTSCSAAFHRDLFVFSTSVNQVESERNKYARKIISSKLFERTKTRSKGSVLWAISLALRLNDSAFVTSIILNTSADQIRNICEAMAIPESKKLISHLASALTLSGQTEHLWRWLNNFMVVFKTKSQFLRDPAFAPERKKIRHTIKQTLEEFKFFSNKNKSLLESIINYNSRLEI